MSSLSIIVVEDHDALREVTVDGLIQRGHSVRGVADGESLDECLAQAPADLVVLDVNLPGENGFDICQRLRRISPQMGIIMLTALGAQAQRVRGYEEGADLYLAKPTSLAELAAAILSLARRAAAATHPGDALVLVEQSGLARGPLGEVRITEGEVAMLRGLALAAQRQLEYWQLLQALDLPDSEEGKAALEVRVVRLRRKLKSVGGTDPHIRSVRSVGYRLCDAWSVF